MVAPRELLRHWPVVLWLVLGVPCGVYVVLAGAPATGGLQKLMQTRPGPWVCAALTLVGLAYGAWQVIRAGRTLSRQTRQPWAEAALRTVLRMSVGVSAAVAGSALLVVRWTGGSTGDRVIGSHILEPLGAVLLTTALLLLLAAVITLFPPGGVLVVAGGGVVATEGAVGVAAVLQAAGILGLAGIVLMAASESGGGGGGGGGGGTPWGNQAQNKQFTGAVREGERRIGRKLDKGEIRRVHDEISGYHDRGDHRGHVRMKGAGAPMTGTIDHDTALATLGRMVGLATSDAKLGHGSFLTVDLRPAPDGPGPGWHLWNYLCAWRLETPRAVVASSEDDRGQLVGLVPQLSGRTLTGVDVDRPSLSTTFTFGELRLRTFSVYPADEEHWLLYLPDGDVLTAGPGAGWSLEPATLPH